MRKESLLELLYSKNLKKTLKYMRRYEAYMRNGISYEELYMIMEYDYKLYLETHAKKNMLNILTPDAIFRYNELCNISTNITSNDDAMCKIKALSLAKENIDEE